VEGRPGQHAVAMTSTDRGKTWSKAVDIEPANGPEASWVMPLKTPYGRIYAFYNYNKDNLRSVKSNSPGAATRVDTMGSYVFKYSDDHGRTWSKDRFEIPMRKMRIDRENEHAGEVMFFWGVGKPINWKRSAIFGFAKVGKWGDPGTMVESQGCFLRSDNILTERDPSRVRWELLPDGDEGLRAPKGPVSDEANPVAMNDGSLYATYRTIDGYSCHAYSRDGGHTWTLPEHMTYSPGGRKVKHPRAANFVKKFSNGRYLYWFHNHGGEAAHTSDWTNPKIGYYRNRNPAFVLGGIERNGVIHWSQPEVLLYEEDPTIRISYPDFIEQEGRYWVTETQKEIARTHEIDKSLLNAIWSQHEVREVSRKGLVLEHKPKTARMDGIVVPRLPNLSERGGFALDLWINFRELSVGQVIFESRTESGKGIRLATSDRFTMMLTMNDGVHEFSCESDPGTHPGTLRVNAWQHIAVVVDAGPRIVSFVIDGEFNDGGFARQFGWTRFPKELGDVNGSTARIQAPFRGELAVLRLYNRYLLTSECIGAYRAGRTA